MLPNGLTLIVHEDGASPVVQLRMFYHVGERDAAQGQAGYPHLFEHLAFRRTEHMPGTVWSFLASIGATNYDATTRYDYTHYFATVPSRLVDTLLWLEAERMTQLAPAITVEDLRISQNEVDREAERLMQLPPIRILKATWDHSYPAAHPYAGFDIASDDLESATLADARRFYANHYHPANAVLVVAGDVDAHLMRDRVNRYFGAVAPGPRPERRRAGIGRRSGTIRKRVEGAVDDARLRFVWNTPGWGTHAADHLGLGATTIASRMASKLKASGLATEVDATMEMRELGGQIMLDVLATSSAVFGDIEISLREEIRRLAAEGVTAEELDHAKAMRRGQFQQEAAGLAGKTYVLGRAELIAGDPGHFDVTQRRTQAARPEDVRLAIRQWLTDGLLVLELGG